MTPGRSFSTRALIAAFAGLAFVLAVLMAPSGAHAASKCAAADNEASLLTKSQEARALLCVINETRARFGRKPVRRSPILDVAALAHSAKMLATGCFEHTCRNERDLAGRLKKAGFPGCNCYWKAAENIAYGQRENSAPSAVVSAWMNSRDHRKALLTRRFKMIGIGILPGMPDAPLNLDSATFTIELGWVSHPV